MYRLACILLFFVISLQAQAAVCQAVLTGNAAFGKLKKTSLLQKSSGTKIELGPKVFNGTLSCDQAVTLILSFDASSISTDKPDQGSLGQNQLGEELGRYDLLFTPPSDVILMDKKVGSPQFAFINGNLSAGKSEKVYLNGASYLLAKPEVWHAAKLKNANITLTVNAWLFPKAVENAEGPTPFHGGIRATLSYI